MLDILEATTDKNLVAMMLYNSYSDQPIEIKHVRPKSSRNVDGQPKSTEGHYRL